MHGSTSAPMLAEAAGRPLRILIGDPATAILEAIDEDDVLLVVIGSGRIRTGAHPLGHVTRAVIALGVEGGRGGAAPAGVAGAWDAGQGRGATRWL